MSNHPVRNFRLPDSLYFDFEFMAAKNRKSMVVYLEDILTKERNKFAKAHGLNPLKMPRTERRQKRIKEASGKK